MIKAFTSEKNERQHRILIDHKDLELLIAKSAAEHVEFPKPKIGAPGVTFKIAFEDATEGSPSYRIGTKAVVTITEDLLPQDALPEEQEKQNG